MNEKISPKNWFLQAMEEEIRQAEDKIIVEYTPINGDRTYHVKAKRIQSVCEEKGQTYLLVRSDDGLKKIAIHESVKDILAQLSGHPSKQTQRKWEREIAQSVQRGAADKIKALLRDNDEKKSVIEQRYIETRDQLADLNKKNIQRIRDIRDVLKSSWRGRFIRSIEDRRTADFEQGKQVREQRLTWLLGPTLLALYDDQKGRQERVDKFKESNQRNQEKRQHELDKVEREAARDYQELLRQRDNPAMSQAVRGELEERIRSFRNDRRYAKSFQFVEVSRGRYENEHDPGFEKRNPDYVERQRRQEIERSISYGRSR
jgi:hypothetical protein